MLKVALHWLPLLGVFEQHHLDIVPPFYLFGDIGLDDQIFFFDL